MDITKLLEKDHRTVDELFKKIEKAKGDEQLNLYATLKQELIVHAAAEEEILYPRLHKIKGLEDKAEHAQDEHLQIKEGLAEVDEADAFTEDWDSAFEELKETVKHHVKDEEGEVFPKMHKMLTEQQLSEWGAELTRTKEILKTKSKKSG